jgi:hypothetical protein
MTDIAEITEPADAHVGEANPKTSIRPGEHAAIVRCILAKQRAFGKALADGKTDFAASIAGNKAFLRALPPLSGFEYIRDFVACVTYAIAAHIVSGKAAGTLLESAKVALASLRHEPESASRAAAA